MEYEVKVAEIHARIFEMKQNFNEHIKREEMDLAPAIRKYLNMALHRDIVRRSWYSVPISAWRVIIPWTVQHQNIHMRRVRFLQALRWAVPEQIHMIGKCVYEGVKDPLLFQRLCVDLPELAPRTTPGYHRFY